MNLQQIFDKSANHLLKQGAKSKLEKGERCKNTCAYRGENGLMCAVGCLIDDAYYDSSMEGDAVDDSEEVREALEKSGIDFHSNAPVLLLLSRLQWIHDDEDVDDWPYHLDKAADVFKLDKNYTGVSKDAI